MKADFSGWASKAGIKCSDGRTITSGAFQHQHQQRVPLVWQHGHTDPENVLGYAILEHREEGIYTYGFFNDSPKGQHMRTAVEHGDINALSIWANQLIERAGSVLHGAIREVSLVLSGANAGAKIENVTLRHSEDGFDDEVLDAAVIYTGLSLEHTSSDDFGPDDDDDEFDDDGDDGDDVDADLGHADMGEDMTLNDVIESMSEVQKNAMYFMIGEALDPAQTELAQSNTTTEGNSPMNIFDKTDKNKTSQTQVLAHDEMASIFSEAKRGGSLKTAVHNYALSHGITDIETLFPDAKLLSDTPDWVKRQTEWVGGLLGGVRKSPMARIRTMSADLTFEDARAKGYIKGSLKKEEFFGLQTRTTEPTTVYKKQSLHRDDVVDITNFDIVAWLKAEMRIMLEEELARAILIGDGREVMHEDKINEDKIRPIARDHELYTTTINVNVDDGASSMSEVVDAVIANRYKYKGTGQPNFYTTEYWIARFLLLRDADGRRLYKNLSELALELRVAAIIAVEVMMDEPNMVGVLVNPVDYVVGTDRGGEINTFDDFDIDYNKQKYLTETRMSGCLVKPKTAMVIMRVAGTDVLVVPTAPTFNEGAGEVTIIDTAGVVYKNGAGTTINAAGSPYAVTPGTTYVVNATPAVGKYFATSDDDSWSFTAPA